MKCFTLIFHQDKFSPGHFGGDLILHADRHEWSEPEGLTRWRFFLAVHPGPELRQWLATNPFSLATAANLSRDIPDRPDWFPSTAAGHTLQQSITGNLIILTSTFDGAVYLADHGKGFNRPARISSNPGPGLEFKN